MNRSIAFVSVVAAALLSACGGGSDQTNTAPVDELYDAPGKPTVAETRVRAPDGAALGRIDVRLHSARGEVDVWVTLDQRSVAAAQAAAASAAGLPSARRFSNSVTTASFKQLAADQRARVQAQQASVVMNVLGLGGRELGRVQIAHNAIAVRIDASRLNQIAALPGVANVRPVIHYELALSETVPYVGASAVQAQGFDGAGVKVAVLDSGVDDTHRNLGGPGTTEAYIAAYGSAPSDPRNTTRDGLFPTPKVVDGFDFVGEQWPNCAPVSIVGPRIRTRSTSRVTARMSPTSSPAVAPTACTKAWPPVRRWLPSRFAALSRPRATAWRCSKAWTSRSTKMATAI